MSQICARYFALIKPSKHGQTATSLVSVSKSQKSSYTGMTALFAISPAKVRTHFAPLFEDSKSRKYLKMEPNHYGTSFSGSSRQELGEGNLTRLSVQNMLNQYFGPLTVHFKWTPAASYVRGSNWRNGNFPVLSGKSRAVMGQNICF